MELKESERINSVKKLYLLKMHEMKNILGINILRVPGGWVYMFDPHMQWGSNIFVPYNEEGRIGISLS